MGERTLAKKTHSQWWWDNRAPKTMIQCSAHRKMDGKQCLHEAAPGNSVCDDHGAAAAQVKAKAATKLQMAAEDMVDAYLGWAMDPTVDIRERSKIVADVLNRLGFTQAQRLTIEASDPVEALFKAILDDPNGLAPAPPALGAHQATPDDLVGLPTAAEAPEIVDAVVVEDLPPHTVHITESGTTPRHIREALARLL